MDIPALCIVYWDRHGKCVKRASCQNASNIK